MYKKDTPEKDRIRCLQTRGTRDANHYEGIALEMPEKKRPRTELTQQQKDSNKRISAKRVKAGHAIGRIKQWARMTDPYDGTVEEFREELAVCTGLANFGLLWDAKRKRPSLGY